MARVSSVSSSEIHDIVSEFVGQLSALVEQDALSRAREVILSAFSSGDSVGVMSQLGPRRRGRPPGRRTGIVAPTLIVKRGPLLGRKRRKAPIQLCPVPGCTNRAAPVFGMVCAKHKDLPKSEIKKFREARRAQRSEGKPSTKLSKQPTTKPKTTTKTTTTKAKKAKKAKKATKATKATKLSKQPRRQAKATRKKATKIARKPRPSGKAHKPPSKESVSKGAEKGSAVRPVAPTPPKSESEI